MMLHAVLPKHYWGEAVSQAADIRNRFSAPRVESKISHELVHGQNPAWTTSGFSDLLHMCLFLKRRGGNLILSLRRV